MFVMFGYTGIVIFAIIALIAIVFFYPSVGLTRLDIAGYAVIAMLSFFGSLFAGGSAYQFPPSSGGMFDIIGGLNIAFLLAFAIPVWFLSAVLSPLIAERWLPGHKANSYKLLFRLLYRY